MQRWALVVEYDGAKFRGWQCQPFAPSVQGALETALSRVGNATIETVCAGRTDAGVHATAQVVHFDAPQPRPARAWVWGTNANLPPEIRAVAACPVSFDFHARFSARARRYRYVLRNTQEVSALAVSRCAHWRRPLCIDAMREALASLLGTHDFSSFRAAGCQAKSPVRTLLAASVTREKDLVWFDFVANAFLHHMVRNLVGSLLEVGSGDRSVAWLGEVLAQRDRRAAGVTAPPDGLYFVGVDYPAIRDSSLCLRDDGTGENLKTISGASTQDGCAMNAYAMAENGWVMLGDEGFAAPRSLSVLRLPWWMTAESQNFEP
ncbi:MAG: tRNA pseudouridine(38-40) synthase TruA [Thioalkalivibrionaceae bacterium]